MANKFTRLHIGETIALNGVKVWKKLNTVTVENAAGNYLTFSSPNSFTLSVVDNKKYWNGTLEYSTNANDWAVWGGTTAISTSNGVLYLRGIGNTYITGSKATGTAGTWTLNGSNISISGNIENLLDYTIVANGEHPVMAAQCYRGMFCDCTSIISAPELPATTLTDYCYFFMFKNCTNLITVPELPATTLADYCYYNMFYGCTSIINAPELPATTLADYCYRAMFYGCTNLITAPELPATTLTSNCYHTMFQNCTSLTTIPALPATTLTDYCYYYMFYGCTSIKLSSSNTGDYVTQYRIPTSGTGTTATSALTSIFNNTGGSFKSTPSINKTYYTSNTVV